MKGEGRAVVQVRNSYQQRSTYKPNLQPGARANQNQESRINPKLALKFSKDNLAMESGSRPDMNTVKEKGTKVQGAKEQGAKEQGAKEQGAKEQGVREQGADDDKPPVSSYNLEASLRVENASIILTSCQR